MFSVNTREEARQLLRLTCPVNAHGQFVAPELAEQQTIENLFKFGARLEAAYERMQKGTGGGAA